MTMENVFKLPTIKSDADMKHFMTFCSQRSCDAMILRDNYSKFQNHQKVRVSAGLFQGIEGRVVRILRDRKLVIPLGNKAVAISGIDRSFFEPID